MPVYDRARDEADFRECSQLAAALDRLKLDFDRDINVHASAAPQTRAELLKAIGK